MWLTLFQIKACRQFSARPLPTPITNNYKSEPRDDVTHKYCDMSQVSLSLCHPLIKYFGLCYEWLLFAVFYLPCSIHCMFFNLYMFDNKAKLNWTEWDSFSLCHINSRDPLYRHGLTLILVCISNHMSKVRDEITYSFPTFNVGTAEVLGGMNK